MGNTRSFIRPFYDMFCRFGTDLLLFPVYRSTLSLFSIYTRSTDLLTHLFTCGISVGRPRAVTGPPETRRSSAAVREVAVGAGTRVAIGRRRQRWQRSWLGCPVGAAATATATAEAAAIATGGAPEEQAGDEGEGPHAGLP